MRIFQGAKRPVILLGHGLRLAGGAHLAPSLLKLGVPVLSSWQAMDMLDSDHVLNFGRPGMYGQRLANKVLYAADHILAIGNRMSIWNCGYEPLPGRVTMVDIDGTEAARLPNADWICMDAKEFVERTMKWEGEEWPEWITQCLRWREQYPWLEASHQVDPPEISPYALMYRLNKFFHPDETIVTDMGTALIAAHQILRLKPPQRIMTSGGMGEMGCALPAAIGAAFATGRRVICLHCDGGMMMNLQELATIAYHHLPIKIIVFDNDGYLMIKHTQNVLGMKRTSVDRASGVGFPNWASLAASFGITGGTVSTWSDWTSIESTFLNGAGPSLVSVEIDSLFPLKPKLDPIRNSDGTITSPRFDDLSPRLA